MGNDRSASAKRDPQRYRVCETCAQEFDTTDLDQVFHHDGDAHQQLPPADGVKASREEA